MMLDMLLMSVIIDHQRLDSIAQHWGVTNCSLTEIAGTTLILHPKFIWVAHYKEIYIKLYALHYTGNYM